MHTEHLQNVSAGQVVAGWLVAIAVTSLAALAFVSAGLMHEESTRASAAWSTIAVAAGFLAGGFFAGFRALRAPILHALGIGIMSLAAWAVLNALATLFFPSWQWPSLSPQLAVGVLFVQFAAAAVGALLGHNVALRGKPGLAEQERA